MKTLIDKLEELNKTMLKSSLRLTPKNPIYKLELEDKTYCTYPEHCIYQKQEKNGYINLCMEKYRK